MAKKISYTLLIILVALSITEISKVSVLIYSSVFGSDCGVLMCMCGSTCGHKITSDHEDTITEIPVLILIKESTKSTCCPSNESDASHQNARVCSCSSTNSSEHVAVIQTLDKVVLQPQLAENTPSLANCLVWGSVENTAPTRYIDDIFHPPRPILQIIA